MILSLPTYDYVSSKMPAYNKDRVNQNFVTFYKLLLTFGPSTLVLLSFSTVLYPLETAKRLMQVNGSLGYNRAFESTLDMFRKTGVKNLYRGYSLHCMKLIPFSFIQFSLYRMIKALSSET